jgi:STE24 endopeptidase
MTADREVQTPDRRGAAAIVVVGGVTLLILGWLLVPWHWLPGGHVHAVPARAVFSAAQITRAEHVSALIRYPAWAGLAVSLLVSIWLGATKVGSRLVERLPGPWTVRTFLAVGAVTGIGTVATLALDARIQQVERAQGLSGEGWGSWLGDQAISAGVTWLFTGIAVLVVVFVARRAPRTWPLWGAAAAVVLAFAGSFAYPVVVEPLFNDFTSMPSGPLRADIFRLAAVEHVHIDDVLIADASRRTTTLNAYVSGFGSTRRVVVYDTMLHDLPRAEIDVVVAHELGHARHQDVLTGTLLGAVGSAVGIGLLGLLLSSGRFRSRVGADGLADPRIVPALLMLTAVASFLVSPIENTISRGVEARADRASLAATEATPTFIALQRELALHALADPSPPAWSQFWFGTHPTVLERIGLAEQLAAQSGK